MKKKSERKRTRNETRHIERISNKILKMVGLCMKELMTDDGERVVIRKV